MALDESNLCLCYNRGCGQKFNPAENKEDSCIHHPGAPYFHDAYKGWSCCKKKCTDFTEFLNIKGCAKSFHNPEKPPEPEKPVVDKSDDVVVVMRAPEPTRMERPPFDTPQVKLECEIASGLMEQTKSLTLNPTAPVEISKEISIGTSCKNNACKEVYKGTESLEDPCVYHPGQPIFHEGAKFWSCCTRRTFEFEAFLNQKGCTTGQHVWIKKEDPNMHKKVSCRYDWHQTAVAVVVAIYAKKYCPVLSKVLLSPVRLTVDLYFPEQGNNFIMDIELCGVIDVQRSKVNMLGSKVEVHLRKAEAGSWQSLDVPHPSGLPPSQTNTVPNPENKSYENQEDDTVDLSDL